VAYCSNIKIKKRQPFFDFYTRTTEVLDISVKETGFQKYLVKVNNFFMPLPFDISTSNGTTRTVINKEGVIVASATPPMVDGKGYYLKKILIQ